MATIKLPTWKEVLSKFTHQLFDLGFRLDRFHRWVHPTGYTVWVGEKSYRYASQGGTKADKSISGGDLRKEREFRIAILTITEHLRHKGFRVEPNIEGGENT